MAEYKKTKSKGPEYRINREIRAPFVRVVGDEVEPVVLPIREAIARAEAMELDLIEISPNADPPVCKMADYSKFLYQTMGYHLVNHKSLSFPLLYLGLK